MQERQSWCERVKTAHCNTITETYETIKSHPIASIAITGFAGIVSASFATTPQNSCDVTDNCTAGTALIGIGGAGAAGLITTSGIYTAYLAKEIVSPGIER